MGHGDGAARGYTSTVTTITPKLDGLTVQVLQGDDQLDLRNDSGRELVIEGYEGEPYLRFDAGGGVFRNANSPATYLNEERYGGVDVPGGLEDRHAALGASRPRQAAYNWHDHRIHWMSTIDPPKVRQAKDKPHHVFDWTVPGSVGGEPLAIRGSLDYKPPPAQQLQPDPDRARSSRSHSPAASSGGPVVDARDRPRRAGDRLRAWQPGRPCSPRDSSPCSPSTARSGERRSATCSFGSVTDAIR